MSSLEFTIENTPAMVALGEDIARILRAGDTVYLLGEMGAGKTTLAQGIVRGLGYTGKVTSPTFNLVNVYQAAIPVYHCDFYRLEEEDICDLGLEDILERDGIVLIEWPERLKTLPAGGALVLEIKLTDDDYDLPRRVVISGCGAEYKTREKELKRLAGTGNR